MENYEYYALVTGAAGGMGSYYADYLAERGYNLLLVDINEERLRELSDKLVSEYSGRTDPDSGNRFAVKCLAQDLSTTDAAEKVFLFADANGCKVDVLVNNAGILLVNETIAIPEKKLSVIMMVHNYTPLMLCRYFVPLMKERKRGYVLNISSLAAWMEWPVIGMYGNTKRFVKGFSRSLRIEMAGTGVSVTTAYFGAVDTPMIKLKPSLRKLARNIAVMITPQEAARKALRATFKKRKNVMPGLLNHIFKPFLVILPDCLLAWVFHRARKYL